jgi:hypothetical protein
MEKHPDFAVIKADIKNLFTMHIMQLPAYAQERMAFIHSGVISRHMRVRGRDERAGAP